MKFAIVTLALAALLQPADEWLRWPASRVELVGKAAYVRGRVGGFFDNRLLKTERSYNYKLAGTWMTPDVIRAAARMQQISQRLSDDDARKLVAEAESVDGTVVIVEIDPREGSGVIPNDWSAFLQVASKYGSPKAVRGVSRPELREVKALAGTLRRNYDYDRFWVVFPLQHEDGTPLFDANAHEAELVVRITDQEGKVRWPIPASLKR